MDIELFAWIAVFKQSHSKIILLTLLFSSSSNTGFLGRGEGDGINVASREISGSTETMPKTKMTTGRYCIWEMTEHNNLETVQSIRNSELSVQCIIFRYLCIQIVLLDLLGHILTVVFEWLMTHPVSSASDRLHRSLLHLVETQSSWTASQSLSSSPSLILCLRDTEKQIAWNYKKLELQAARAQSTDN